MGLRVRLVPVLVGHHESLVLGDEVLGQRDRAVRTEGAGGIDHLRAVQRGHLAALVRDVVRHDERDAVALATADHREGDPGVARGRLQDDRVLVEELAPFQVLDQVLRDAILDRARRVEHLELGEQVHARVRRHTRDLDDGRVPDRVEDVAEPPAVASEVLVGMGVIVVAQPPR